MPSCDKHLGKVRQVTRPIFWSCQDLLPPDQLAMRSNLTNQLPTDLLLMVTNACFEHFVFANVFDVVELFWSAYLKTQRAISVGETINISLHNHPHRHWIRPRSWCPLCMRDSTAFLDVIIRLTIGSDTCVSCLFFNPPPPNKKRVGCPANLILWHWYPGMRLGKGNWR